MRRELFRQWVVCAMVVAVLCGAVAPNVCRCENCPCGNNSSEYDTKIDFAIAGKKCCCGSSEVIPEKKCCGGSSEVPCRCCDILKDHAIVPKAVLQVKKPNLEPVWDIVPVLTFSSAHTLRLSCFDSHRVLLPPHVPLHILLCVFRN